MLRFHLLHTCCHCMRTSMITNKAILYFMFKKSLYFYSLVYKPYQPVSSALTKNKFQLSAFFLLQLTQRLPIKSLLSQNINWPLKKKCHPPNWSQDFQQQIFIDLNVHPITESTTSLYDSSWSINVISAETCSSRDCLWQFPLPVQCTLYLEKRGIFNDFTGNAWKNVEYFFQGNTETRNILAISQTSVLYIYSEGRLTFCPAPIHHH